MHGEGSCTTVCCAALLTWHRAPHPIRQACTQVGRHLFTTGSAVQTLASRPLGITPRSMLPWPVVHVLP